MTTLLERQKIGGMKLAKLLSVHLDDLVKILGNKNVNRALVKYCCQSIARILACIHECFTKKEALETSHIVFKFLYLFLEEN